MTDDGWHDLGQKLRDAGVPYFICPRCSIINVNPNDVRERYCGRCHRFVDDPTKPGPLKPCPFCGHEPEYKSEQQDKPPFGLRVWIRCPQCRQSQVCSDWYDGDLGTMEASWQKRISD